MLRRNLIKQKRCKAVSDAAQYFSVATIRSNGGRFARDRQGNIAILFALMSAVLFLFAGGAVDYARWNAVRADMIESMDAASLAVAQLAESDSSKTDAELKTYGENFFKENFSYENDINSFALTFDLSDSTVVSTCVTGSIDTYLLGVAGIDELDVDNCVEITKYGTGKIELALVLDVTGSMNSQIDGVKKINGLKSSVTKLLDIMFGSDVTSDNVKIGVVPFAALVNPGGASSWSSDWEDSDAEAYYHGANFFHVDEYGNIDMTTKVNHFHLFNSSSDLSWEGCVESRPYPLDELDVPTNGSITSSDLDDAEEIPSGYQTGTSANDLRNYVAFNDAPTFALSTSELTDTDNLLWVPAFMPDGPDCNDTDDCDDGDYDESGTVGSHTWNGFWFDNPETDADAIRDIELADYKNRFFIDDYKYTNFNQGTPFEKYVPIVSYFREVANPSGTITDSAFKSFLESYGVDTATDRGYKQQEYIMRSAYVGWWDPATSTYQYKYDLSPKDDFYEGPNRRCPDEILPLTNVRADIENHVNGLSTGGNTNSAHGAMWGWRVLSNEPPFTEGIGASDADFSEWNKAVVIMTDGENKIGDYDTHFYSEYATNGFAIESRMGSGMSDPADMLDELDNKLLRICHRMKAEGYLVYTIMFGLDSDSTEETFRACASEPTASDPDAVYFFDAATGAELEDAFGDIAVDLVDLHISK